MLAGLFHTVYLFAWRIRHFDYVVIEVNPRHAGFYKRSLGFDVISPERHNPRVNAPAVLMGISFTDIAHHLHRHTNVVKPPGDGEEPLLVRLLAHGGGRNARQAAEARRSGDTPSEQYELTFAPRSLPC